jgi:hypothetical protein
MPTEIRVIRASEFLRATAEGAYDLEDSRQVLLGLASAVPSPEDIDVLIDFREVSTELTLPNLYQLAREYTELRIAANRRTAVLVPPDRFDDAEFFAISAGGMGRRVSAFTSFEEAFDWLAAESTSS